MTEEERQKDIDEIRKAESTFAPRDFKRRCSRD